MSDCIPRLSASHSPVFLLNSCLDLFSAPPSPEDPFSRSYRVILPNSLTVNHPSASVYSTRPRVSVYGTGAATLKLSGFSRESASAVTLDRSPQCTVRLQLNGWICLPVSTPIPFNLLFRQQAAVSRLRLRIARCGSNGILTVMPSASPLGLSLGPD